MLTTGKKIRRIIRKVLKEEYNPIYDNLLALDMKAVDEYDSDSNSGISGSSYYKFKIIKEEGKASRIVIALDEKGVLYYREMSSRKPFEPLSDPTAIIRVSRGILKKYRNLPFLEKSVEKGKTKSSVKKELESRLNQSLSNLKAEDEQSKDFNRVYEYYNPSLKQYFKLSSADVDMGGTSFFPFPKKGINGKNYRMTSDMQASRTITVKGKTKTRSHKGFDIGYGEKGTPLFSPDNGVITSIKNQEGGAGKYIKILHKKEGYVSMFMHLNDYAHRRYNPSDKYEKIKVGDNVKAGEIIGFLGNTGGSTGPHLHFEARDVDGKAFKSHEKRMEKMKKFFGYSGNKKIDEGTCNFMRYEEIKVTN